MSGSGRTTWLFRSAICQILTVLVGAAVLTSTAFAKVELTTGATANYRVRIMSWSEIPFRSVVRQQYDFSCGSAALATLLSFHYDRDTPERPIFAAMWAKGNQQAIRKFGFSMLDIKHYLDGMSLKAEGYRTSLDDLKKLDRPGIVILDLKGYRHFVVVKGVIGGEVLVGDPMLGLMRYSAKAFSSHWNGIFLTIVDQAGQPRPRFNVATDWRPWSVAPTGAVDLGTPVGRITDNLPPTYQISPLALSIQTGTAVR